METTTYQPGTKVTHSRFTEIAGVVEHVFSDGELLIRWNDSQKADYYTADEVTA